MVGFVEYMVMLLESLGESLLSSGWQSSELAESKNNV